MSGDKEKPAADKPAESKTPKDYPKMKGGPGPSEGQGDNEKDNKKRDEAADQAHPSVEPEDKDPRSDPTRDKPDAGVTVGTEPIPEDDEEEDDIDDAEFEDLDDEEDEDDDVTYETFSCYVTGVENIGGIKVIALRFDYEGDTDLHGKVVASAIENGNDLVPDGNYPVDINIDSDELDDLLKNAKAHSNL